LFDKSVPSSVTVSRRKMFGYPAAFANGNLFIGLHQNDFIMRLSEEDRTRFRAEYGERIFEPMKGRPMREYVRLRRNCWPMHGSARRGSNDRWNTQKESSPRRGARNSVVSSQECWLFVQFATGEVQVTLSQQGGHREEVYSFALRI